MGQPLTVSFTRRQALLCLSALRYLTANLDEYVLAAAIDDFIDADEPSDGPVELVVSVGAGEERFAAPTEAEVDAVASTLENWLAATESPPPELLSGGKAAAKVYEHSYANYDDGTPLTTCPDCGHDLTAMSGVSVTFTDGADRTLTVAGRLDPAGKLVDDTGMIANGLHSDTECGQCGYRLSDYESV